MELQLVKNKARIIKTLEQTIILNELDWNSLNLNNIDKLVLSARMNGETIGDVKESERKLLCDVAIFKIAAIVGFSLPTSEKFADTLNEEFLRLLFDFGYSEITFEEVITAFRVNAHGGYRTNGGDTIMTVIPYSTFFSINYAASVLNNYMRIRKMVEYKILEKSAQQLAKKYS